MEPCNHKPSSKILCTRTLPLHYHTSQSKNSFKFKKATLKKKRKCRVPEPENQKYLGLTSHYVYLTSLYKQDFFQVKEGEPEKEETMSSPGAFLTSAFVEAVNPSIFEVVAEVSRFCFTICVRIQIQSEQFIFFRSKIMRIHIFRSFFWI